MCRNTNLFSIATISVAIIIIPCSIATTTVDILHSYRISVRSCGCSYCYTTRITTISIIVIVIAMSITTRTIDKTLNINSTGSSSDNYSVTITAIFTTITVTRIIARTAISTNGASCNTCFSL